MVFVQDIAVSGEYMEKVVDKRFVVISKPEYEELPSLKDPDKKEKKCVMSIELSDGTALDYYPNKTSLKAMANLFSYEMDNWVGKQFEFIVTPQIIAGNDRMVLYVREAKK